MRIRSSVTTLSWIPSYLVDGLNKLAFESRLLHYDDPPPEVISDLEALRQADRFRFANRLAAWIDVSDGQIVDAGYDPSSGLMMGSTTVRLPRLRATFQGVPFPELRREPDVSATSARFVQTAGGRTALPAPRRVAGAPFIQLDAPAVWTTLALTLHADGRAEHQLTGASPFPRHWVYDADGRLAAKAGLTDSRQWWLHAFGKHTPWGDEDSPALVTTVETALERQLAAQIMRGRSKPHIKKLEKGDLLAEQGAARDEVYLLLDGILLVEVDGRPLAEIGPGAIVGELASLQAGVRTATLRAATPVRVAAARTEQISHDALVELGAVHHRETT
jgi:Cyclic nucleotide-binding domain